MSKPENTVRLHRVLKAPAKRVYRAFLDADALAQVPAIGPCRPEPAALSRMLLAQIADDRLAMIRIADNGRQHLFCESHGFSRIDSRPLVMFAIAPWVARIAFSPADVTA